MNFSTFSTIKALTFFQCLSSRYWLMFFLELRHNTIAVLCNLLFWIYSVITCHWWSTAHHLLLYQYWWWTFDNINPIFLFNLESSGLAERCPKDFFLTLWNTTPTSHTTNTGTSTRLNISLYLLINNKEKGNVSLPFPRVSTFQALILQNDYSY